MSLAVTLGQFGVPYQLYERNQHLSYEDVCLGLSANTFPILRSWDIFDEAAAIGTYIKDFHFVNKHFKYLKSFKMKAPALSVRRKELYAILQQKLIDADVHLGSAKSHDDFQTSDIVVSADGIHSRTRKAWYPSVPLRDSGQLLWRGISKMKLPPKYQHAYHDLIGNNLRFAIIHTGEDYYSWYLIRQIKEEIVELDSKEALLEHFLAEYPEIVREVVIHSNDVFFSRLIDIAPRKRKDKPWYKGNHLLIGDAIHPTTPNMANGACLSIEDGYVLGSLLAKGDALPKTFELFQKDRERKVNNIVTQSWLFGKSMHWDSQLMTYLTEKMTQLTPQLMFEKIYSVVLQESKVLSKNIKE